MSLAVEIIFYIGTFITLLGVVAQMSKFKQWWIRFFDFPTKQILALQVFVSALFLIIYQEPFNQTQWITLMIGGFCLIYLSYIIFPYTPLHRKEMNDAADKADKISFSVMSANVYMYNEDFQKLIDLVNKERPDLLLLLETNKAWENGVEVLKEDYPYTILYPLENTYGLLFYSKCPIGKSEVRFLLKDEIPSIKASIKISDHQELCFYGVHPEPPAPEESDTSEPRDIELLKVAKEVKDRDDLIMVTGDLNDVAWSHSTRLFRRYSGLLDPRIGRGTFNTFHVK
ncbi:MAG: endonuclease/exonuclease/phosphatase family protein [Maribacter sp.]